MSLSSLQIFARQSGIGGSDAAAAVGLSRWKTPLRLWQEKTGQCEREEPSGELAEAAHFGHVLENVVADEFARRRGVKIRRDLRTLRHPKHPFMLGHIDRRILGTKVGLEVKTISLRMSKDLGEDDDAIPTEWFLQALHYMACTGFASWCFAVLVAGNSFRTYQVKRDDETIENLIGREREFWRHVETNTPPDPISLEDASRRWPFDAGTWTIADAEIAERCAHLGRLRNEMKTLKTAADEEELLIKRAMGDCGTLLASGTERLATWTTQEATTIDVRLLRSKYPEVAKNCERVSSSRVFRLK